MNKNYTDLLRCVACDKEDLFLAIDLGKQPLANDYLQSSDEFEKYPLALNICKYCFHGQLSIAVNPLRLFRDYPYVSGTSETMSRYFSHLAAKIISEHGKSGKLIDIGSNDGSFLAKFIESDWNVIGVDPAENLVPIAKNNGVTTIPSFFNEKISKILAKDFDVIVAMNVFAHNKDPFEILTAIKNCLKENGKVYIQTSQANMMSNYEFDTIYHEHISFFNVKSMRKLCERVGMKLVNVSIVPVHGDSYLWEICKIASNSDELVLSREKVELDHGLYDLKHYEKFEEFCTERVNDVLKIVEDFRSKGYSIATYGAAAKGNTFLNFGNIQVDYIFDDTPHKIGKMAPAGGCVVSEPYVLKTLNKELLILIPAWNFSDEISSKIEKLRNTKRDYLLRYFPTVELTKLELSSGGG